MPIYEYICKKCQKSCEVYQKFGDAPPQTVSSCTETGCELEKQISKTNFSVKSPNPLGQIAQKLTDQGSSPFKEDSGKTEAHKCGSGCALHSKSL